MKKYDAFLPPPLPSLPYFVAFDFLLLFFILLLLAKAWRTKNVQYRICGIPHFSKLSTVPHQAKYRSLRYCGIVRYYGIRYAVLDAVLRYAVLDAVCGMLYSLSAVSVVLY